jgi:AcrR family transcriptional regulator
MNDNFISLGEEKRDRIINAALQEFASKGFALASTNEIVKRAGISKGALFHYFASKEDLYQFLCNYVFEIVKRDYYAKIEDCGGDFISRYVSALKRKQALFKQYPYFFDFTIKLWAEPAEILGDTLREKLAETMAYGYKCLMDGIDESFFRADIPAGQVKELIIWSVDGSGRKKMESWKDCRLEDIDLQAEEQEVETFMHSLRICFYQ